VQSDCEPVQRGAVQAAQYVIRCIQIDFSTADTRRIQGKKCIQIFGLLRIFLRLAVSFRRYRGVRIMRSATIGRVARIGFAAILLSAPVIARAQSAQSGDQLASFQNSGVVAPAPAPAAGTSSSLPSAPTPQVLDAPYESITRRERFRWILDESISPLHLAGTAISSAYGTAMNDPAEDGPHWAGFGKRFGATEATDLTEATMESGLGAAWGEDPRYFRDSGDTFAGRVRNIVKQTFVARRPDGSFAPAYARYIAIPGSNFLSDVWRPRDDATTEDALIRTAESFGGRCLENTLSEFWPNIKDYVFHASE
jgi:hypothetical protein